MNGTPLRYTGTKIADILQAQGRRRDWLAKQVGVSASTVTRWCQGSLSISEAHATRVASVLGVPLFLITEFRNKNDHELVTEQETAA